MSITKIRRKGERPGGLLFSFRPSTMKRTAGGMAEWLKAAVLKTAFRFPERGFESLSLRHFIKEDALSFLVQTRPGFMERKHKVSDTGKLTGLRNIGKATAEKLERIGIDNREEFLRRDPYEIFEKLLEDVDPTLCRCVLASIVGAASGTPWHRITKKTAAEYTRRHPAHRWGPC